MSACLRFAAVDVMKSRKLLLLMLVIIGVGSFFCLKVQLFAGILYMFFGGNISAMQPFMQEQRTECGFFDLLPGSRNQKVWGRFSFGLLTMLFCLAVSILQMLLLGRDAKLLPWAPAFALGVLGVALILMSLQYMFFYGLGKSWSREFAGLVAMSPGMLLFLGGYYLMGRLEEAGPAILMWLADHGQAAGGVLCLAGLLCWAGGALGASALVKKRDQSS